jgi:AraC-like DNA-binding protein
MARGTYTTLLLAAVASVKEFIDNHPLEKKTTQELAEQVGISRSLLQQIFHQKYHTHIKKYCTLKKMQSAKQLLQEGIAIRQVAKRCHYHSHSAFTTAFKNKFGVTPLGWLKENL